MKSIRDHLISRARQANIYRFGIFTLIMGLMLLLDRLGLKNYVFVPILLAATGILIPLGELFARCPKCRYPLQVVGRIRLRYGAKKYRTNFCPHCGLAFDAPHEK
jgi:hypothetical protein